MVVELIAKDKNEKFQHEGRCKLIIDDVSKLLLVEPFNEEYKMISAMFKWQFVAQKNIIYVFAEYVFQDFALIFDNTAKCNKVYDTLIKKKAIAGNKNLITERFLPQLFEKISTDDESTVQLKEILIKWIKHFDGKEKDKYIHLLKNYNIYDLIFPIKFQENAKPLLTERKFVMKVIIIYYTKRLSGTLSKIIETPHYKILKYVFNGQLTTKLFIVSKLNRNYCYEYYWKKLRNHFVCYNCRHKGKQLTAKIIQRNGKDAIQLNENQHVCELRKYKEIVEQPNFEIITYESNKTRRNRLIIFFDISQVYCYEYFRINHCKIYYCCGCIKMKQLCGANICQKEDGNEFALLQSKQHVCEPRKYNPEKYAEKEIVEAANFQIFKNSRNEIEKSTLIIFAPNDTSKCFEYIWHNSHKTFVCFDCRKQKNYVAAQVISNSDGSNYVKLNRKKHVCEPREYDPEKFDVSKKDIVDSSNFKIFKYKHNGAEISRLIVFCATNKNLCYEYYWRNHVQLYQCTYCPAEKQVIATVCQKEESKDYLILSKNQHKCELREFNPEKYRDDVAVEKSMYKTVFTKLKKSENFLMLFTTEEKKFYYKYLYDNKRKCYYCTKCYSFKAFISATIQNEGKVNECVHVSNQKHVCKPLEYTSVVDNNIIIAPNFQLTERKLRGKNLQHLVVFTNDEKSECYDYTWDERNKSFKCNACSYLKFRVYAKVFKNDEHEECVELCKTEQKCIPVKFDSQNNVVFATKIVKEPDFKLYETIYRGKNIKKLAVFDSNKNMDYLYTYHGRNKTYLCQPCSAKNKHVAAKVLQDENGQNYIELNKAEHICDLLKL